MTARLADIRRARGLTVRHLAARAGVSTETLWRAEQGRPVQIATFQRLARALEVSVLDLAELRSQLRLDE